MLNVGIIIGERYEIAGKIGAGGMADVYKAKDHKLNRFVAIKVLKQEFREDKTFIKKFQTEAQAAAGLAHPNIVNVFDVGEDSGTNYIVMELVEGITLKEYITKKGKLSVKEATSIAIQVSMGLETAHNHNIVHRDVKPQNIIISTDGKVKVTDFGIARAASSNTISSNVMGSVHYSSPEQVRGGYSDAKSDIYSLGVTIYEMVTGKVPFEGDTTVAIAIKHLQEEIVPPTQYNSQLPFSLEQIILKCTQKSVDRRYNTMGEVIADLKHSLIDPQGDFVNLVPLSNHAQTVVISNSELEEIKQGHYGTPESNQNSAYNSLDDESDLEEEEEDDDDDISEGGINTKLEKAMTIGGLIIGAIIIIVLIAFIGKAAGIFTFGSDKNSKDDTKSQTEDTSNKESDKTSDQVEVPNIVGKSEEEATSMLTALGIGGKYDGEEASSKYEEGMVISQDVEAGTKVDKHSTVKYKRSSGNSSIKVPDVTGSTQTKAEEALTELGLKTNIEKSNSSDVAIGNVISTDPAAGTAVNKGDTVTVKISIGKGDTTVKVPTVIGLSEQDAKDKLESVNLNVKVESGNSSDVDEGEVYAQDVKGGKSVDVGTTVTITVNTKGNSTGTDDKTTTPDSNSGAGSGTWKSANQALGEPQNYAGGPVKLELSQEVNGSIEASTILEGEKIKFPYSLKGVEGAAGVAEGTVILYEKVDDEYVPRSSYTVTFKQVE